MSAIEQAIAEIATLKREIEIIKAKERPLTLRGWRDDFLGDSLYGQYSTLAGVGGAVNLVDGFHGGAVRLSVPAAAGAFIFLYLGGGFDTLDADYGWEQITRFTLDGLVDCQALFGAHDQGVDNNRIQLGYDSASGANWIMRTRIGGGATTVTDSGVAADTDPHWHRAIVFPTTTGHRVDYFLDGTLIASTTATIPIIVIEPHLVLYTAGGTARQMDVDIWDIIPMNL